MATRISTTLSDASTTGLRFTLADANGDAALVGAIASITYTLSDSAGTVINDLEDEALTPANPVTVVLDPADMTATGAASVTGRYLTLTWTYTDALLGAGTVKAVEYFLTIENFVNK